MTSGRLVKQVEIPAEVFPALPGAMRRGFVDVLAMAVNGRLFTAPLGTAPWGPGWLDCGNVGWEGDAAHPLATAVQAAWAAVWA